MSRWRTNAWCTARSSRRNASFGNGAIVLDGVRIGPRAMVAAHALVTPGTQIPGGVLALGAPATVRGPLSGSAAEWVSDNPGYYAELAQRHRRGLVAVE